MQIMNPVNSRKDHYLAIEEEVVDEVLGVWGDGEKPKDERKARQNLVPHAATHTRPIMPAQIHVI